MTNFYIRQTLRAVLFSNDKYWLSIVLSYKQLSASLLKLALKIALFAGLSPKVCFFL